MLVEDQALVPGVLSALLELESGVSVVATATMSGSKVVDPQLAAEAWSQPDRIP